MTLRGGTVAIGLASFPSTLARPRQAGRLSISVEGNEVRIFHPDGDVIPTSSAHRGLRRGRVMVRPRVVGRGATGAGGPRSGPGRMRPAAGPDPSGARLGHVRRLRQDRGGAADEQAIEALANIMVIPRGTLLFSQGTRPAAKDGLVSLNAANQPERSKTGR